MKYFEVSEELNELFEEVLTNSTISQSVAFKLVGDNTCKKPCDIKKSNEYVEYLGGNDVAVFFNEDVLDSFSDEDKKLLIEEELSFVSVNLETDKITIGKPNISTSSGFLNKYKNEVVVTLKESVLAAYDAIKAKKEEEKATKTN